LQTGGADTPGYGRSAMQTTFDTPGFGREHDAEISPLSD
jgi:hypothetical protein